MARMSIRQAAGLCLALLLANTTLDRPAAAASTIAGDRAAIAEVIAGFAYRDQGRWTELRDLFTADATIAVSWYSGPVDGFVAASQRMTGAQTKHWLGVPRIVVCGDEALAETDVTIMVRAPLATGDIDVTNWARFFDRFRRDADGQWRIAARTAIYEKDRIDPVDPGSAAGALPASDDRHPRALRHLAALLASNGLPLMADVVTAGSEAERALKAAALTASGCGGPQSRLP